jgi:hypothetical protein
VAQTLEAISQAGFSGHVIAEISTRNAGTEEHRVSMVKSSLDFARYYQAVGRERNLAEATG